MFKQIKYHCGPIMQTLLFCDTNVIQYFDLWFEVISEFIRSSFKGLGPFLSAEQDQSLGCIGILAKPKQSLKVLL